MNFKNWLLITEGVIKIPYKVIEPIVNDYFNFFKNINLGKEKAIDKKYTYTLDLSGTNYDFPNIIPKLNVTYKGIRGKMIGGYVDSETKIEFASSMIIITGNIILKKNLPSIISPVELIEHEVLHFIQDIISIHMSYNKQIYKKNNERPEFSGSGPRKLTQDLMKAHDIDFYGYDTRTGKIIAHEKRPTEFQTNLNSIIINIKRNFVNKFLSGNLNPSYFSYDYDIVKDIKTREDFEKNKDAIIEFINDQNKKNKFIRDGITTKFLSLDFDLDKIKKFNKELYNWYLNEIYKNFVTKDIEKNQLTQIVDEYFFNKNKLSDEDPYLANKINFQNFINFYRNEHDNNYTISHSNNLVENPKPSELIENVSAIYLYDFLIKVINKFYQKKDELIDSEWAKKVEREKEYKYYFRKFKGYEVNKKTINRYDLKNIFWFIKNLKRKFDVNEEFSEKIATFLAEDIAWAYERHYENKNINKKPPTAEEILKGFYEL